MKKYILALIPALLATPSFADVAGPRMRNVFRYHNGTIWDADIFFEFYFFPMVLTAAIETFVLWRFKEYRKWGILAYFAILNLISNVLVNYLHATSFFSGNDNLLAPSHADIFLLELGAVLFEFIWLGLKTGYSKKLLFVVFICNLISFLIGVILFGFPT